ncbi:hypothetical protein TSUD_101080 [Trifolium subterraneum]|uniref:B-like cyclin n=1 Tax=Trifolium subterraneum TaxID=3900 RepID=A0A2Z6P2P4_TRISU|nr:hypothetical protein TSUD_101080 [Trifolium subterraneum]
MYSEPEFPYPSSRSKMETIKYYFYEETEFMPATNFFNDDRNILIRRNGVSIIAKVTKKDDQDAFVPYLAMNYFDRFLSRYNMRHVEGRTDTEKVRLIAISCFTISAKMRIDSFSVDQFLSDLNKDMNLRINHQMVMRMEFLILQVLSWKMKSVTAFCFLNHYYPHFRQFRGFKRRSINEIIVQAQGDHTFVDYRPSHIAFSAFLAAAKIAYPVKYREIAEDIESKLNDQGQVKECAKKMIDLCRRTNILIDTPRSGIHSASSEAVTVPQKETKEAGTPEVKEIQQNKNKAVVVDDSSEEEEENDRTALINKQRQDIGKMETSQLQVQEGWAKLSDKKDVAAEENETSISEIEEELVEPKKLMNFELKWATDAPSLEAQPRESTIVSLRIPGTGKNINIGCGTCNIS